MNFKEIKILNFAQDLINLFSDYSFGLDKYFEKEKNKKEHLELYNEYMVLSQNIRNLKGKYKL